ncbi:MAG: helix-turn-helix domain-containing protein [Chloroflexota bacterium]
MKMWSVKQAAKELGISERRVRKLLAEGRIKGKKLNGFWVVLKLSYTRKRGH